MHTSNTLYPSDVCSLFSCLSIWIILFSKKKRKTTTIDVWSISKVNYRRSPSSSHRERENRKTHAVSHSHSLTYVNNPSLNYY